MASKKNRIDHVFIILFFLILFGAFFSKYGYVLYKNFQSEETYSISSPGRPHISPMDFEGSFANIPGYRDVYDFNVPWGDDYIYENKWDLQPIPLISKVLGGIFLFLSFGDTDILLIWMILFVTLTHFFLFLCFRKIGIPPLGSLAGVLVFLTVFPPYIFGMRIPSQQLMNFGIHPFITTLFIVVISVAVIYLILAKKHYFHRFFSPKFLTVGVLACLVITTLISLRWWIIYIVHPDEHLRLHIVDNVGSPAMTFFFFILFLFFLFQDPSIQHRKSALLLGGVGGLNFYVHYSNFFCISFFLACYLPFLFYIYPEYRKNYFRTAFTFIITAIPFILIFLISKLYLPEDYMLKTGLSQFTTVSRYHWAVIPTDLRLIQYTFSYVLAPLLLCFISKALAYRAKYLADKNCNTPSIALFLKESFSPDYLLLIAVGIIGMINTILPGYLQQWISMPQPDRILRKSYPIAAHTHSILFVWLSIKIILSSFPQVKRKLLALGPTKKALAKSASYILIILLLLIGSSDRIKAFDKVDLEKYLIEPEHLLVLDILQEKDSPCVFSSSEVYLSALVASRTACDLLGPNVITSSSSTREALERHVAIWALENRSLNEVLYFFRVHNLEDNEPYRKNCVINPDGTDIHHGEIHEDPGWYGINLVFHQGPCNPLEVKANIIKIYNKYHENPELIFQNYRVDWIYSKSDDILQGARKFFKPSIIKGLYKKT